MKKTSLPVGVHHWTLPLLKLPNQVFCGFLSQLMATKSLIYLRSAELMNSFSYSKLVLQPLLQNKLRVFCYPFYLTFTRSCWRTHKGSWRPYNILCQQPEYALPKVWQVEIHATSGVGTDLFLNSISTNEESCLCNSFPSLDRYFAGFTCSIECQYNTIQCSLFWEGRYTWLTQLRVF